MDRHPSVSDASFNKADTSLMQNPFPSENQAESMPKKDSSLAHFDKNKKIQTVISKGKTSLQTLAGALFQTIAVTQKLRHRA